MKPPSRYSTISTEETRKPAQIERKSGDTHAGVYWYAKYFLLYTLKQRTTGRWLYCKQIGGTYKCFSRHSVPGVIPVTRTKN